MVVDGKLVVLIRGVSYMERYRNIKDGRIRRVDWKKSRDNIQCNILQSCPYRSVEVYLASYASSEQDAVMDFYKPKAHVFESQMHSQKHLLMRGMELVLQNNNADAGAVDASTLLIIRFDVRYNAPLWQSAFDASKFNVLWKESTSPQDCVCDCIHMMPMAMAARFLQALQDLPYHKTIHRILMTLPRDVEVHYVLGDDACYDSDTDRSSNPLFVITR